ncbi:MAG: helix-turn-helix transcriptional regulator [Streptosporangiaceae bacterium]
MTSERKIANPLALAVLTLLQERPMHPYEMVATLRARGKEDSINIKYGSLYTVVRALRREGLVEESETVRAGRRPERTVYALTDRGRREIGDWLRELLGELKPEFPHFLAGLSLMPALPLDEVAKLLEGRAARVAERMEMYRSRMAETTDQGVAEIFLVEDDYRLALDRAELEWLRGLVAALRAGTITGVRGWREYHEGGREARPDADQNTDQNET